jgi:hypothetical protein
MVEFWGVWVNSDNRAKTTLVSGFQIRGSDYTMSQNRLEKFIAEICSLAKDICLDAEITVSTNSIEGEDARIKIIVPDDKADDVDETVSARSYEIFIDEGYDILTSVYFFSSYFF